MWNIFFYLVSRAVIRVQQMWGQDECLIFPFSVWNRRANWYLMLTSSWLSVAELYRIPQAWFWQALRQFLACVTQLHIEFMAWNMWIGFKNGVKSDPITMFYNPNLCCFFILVRKHHYSISYIITSMTNIQDLSFFNQNKYKILLPQLAGTQGYNKDLSVDELKKLNILMNTWIHI